MPVTKYFPKTAPSKKSIGISPCLIPQARRMLHRLHGLKGMNMDCKAEKAWTTKHRAFCVTNSCGYASLSFWASHGVRKMLDTFTELGIME